MSYLRSRIAHLTDAVLEEMTNAKLQMNMQVDREGIYWEQRARANWLKNEDRNTIFFHKFASQRKRLIEVIVLKTVMVGLWKKM